MNPVEKCFCDICGSEVKEMPGVPSGFGRTINVAILGESLEVKGHSACLENVNNLVVIPNRARLLEITEGIKIFLKFLDDSQSKVKANPDPPRVSPGKSESGVQRLWNRGRP